MQTTRAPYAGLAMNPNQSIQAEDIGSDSRFAQCDMCEFARSTLFSRQKVVNFSSIAMAYALLIIKLTLVSEPKREGSRLMVRMIKKVGDRELAWVMLAAAAIALWSTWGLTS